ncbi:(2Fe-2S)-binding protein [Acrocarpospora pleiomorpha]|uniref:(2Fe-2S)-binding protein n=1 Tax=Acrocarpospora pleiomorpha TaxID=90975 RepID=UPI0012D33D75|nr:2Fe-2S iron-sulfur cluster-binding protein [Acrocarpospora pleiomorpha]
MPDPGEDPGQGPREDSGDDLVEVRGTLDGEPYHVEVPVWASLLDALEAAGRPLPAGCRGGQCGSCTVTLDGVPAPACVVPAGAAAGAVVETARRAALPMLVEEMAALSATQCGYCAPGLVVALSHLLSTNPALDASAVREALTGHLCRCTGYEAIVTATLAAAARLRFCIP